MEGPSLPLYYAYVVIALVFYFSVCVVLFKLCLCIFYTFTGHACILFVHAVLEGRSLVILVGCMCPGLVIIIMLIITQWLIINSIMMQSNYENHTNCIPFWQVHNARVTRPFQYANGQLRQRVYNFHSFNTLQSHASLLSNCKCPFNIHQFCAKLPSPSVFLKGSCMPRHTNQ